MINPVGLWQDVPVAFPRDEIFGGEEVYTVIVVETTALKPPFATIRSAPLSTPSVSSGIPIIGPVLSDHNIPIVHIHDLASAIAPWLDIRDGHFSSSSRITEQW